MAQARSSIPIERFGLYDYLASPQRRSLRALAKPSPVVVDDWPNRIPVTRAELDVLEAHLAEVLDRLLETRRG
jgi:hypothetical protein